MESLRFLRKWRKVRKIGKVYYIFSTMFLILLGGLAVKLIWYYFTHGTLSNFNLDSDLIGIVCLSLLGIAVGIGTWNWNEGRYKGTNFGKKVI